MSWKYLCNANEVGLNAVKLVEVDSIRILVVNHGAGFHAMPPICPHMEEPLEESGVIANCILTCTKHLWAWDLRTLDMLGETEKPLKTYSLKEEDGRLFAFVGQEIIYDFDEEDELEDDFFYNS